MKRISHKGKRFLIDDEDLPLLDECTSIVYNFRNDHYYVMVTHQKKITYLHRLIMGLKKGDPRVVDHIDKNTLNNQKSNLRICTRAENSQNRKTSKNKKLSKYKGVRKASENAWRSSIRVKGKLHNIGTFKTEKEAAKKYNEHAKLHFGEFAQLNKIR